MPARHRRCRRGDRHSDPSPGDGPSDRRFSRSADRAGRRTWRGALGRRRRAVDAMTATPIDERTDDPAGTTRHAYPAAAMVGDYLRAAAGLVPVGVLFATLPVGAVAAGVLGSFAAIFAAFGLRTA